MIVKNKTHHNYAAQPSQHTQQVKKPNYEAKPLSMLDSMALNDSFDNIIHKLRKELLVDIDKNHDGSLTETELSNATRQAVTSPDEKRVFDQLDVNSDGKIDGNELAAVLTGDIYKNKKRVSQVKAEAPKAVEPSPLQNILAAQKMSASPKVAAAQTPPTPAQPSATVAPSIQAAATQPSAAPQLATAAPVSNPLASIAQAAPQLSAAMPNLQNGKPVV